MDEKIFELINELISTGSVSVIWAIAIIYGAGLLKSIMWLFGFLFVVRYVGGGIIKGVEISK